MKIRLIARVLVLSSLFAAASAFSQEKPQPQVMIDLKPLGAAPDLFSNSSDSKYLQRGLINVFWLGEDRIAVAFSTSRRWSSTDKPEPLQVRLLVFDREGKKQASRDWNVGAEGPDSQTTLEVSPGPDNSILVTHEPNSGGKIPDGDFIQVLNPDTTLRQDLYVPATSAWIPSVLPDAGLIIETYYASNRSSLAWWSGKPLKAGTTLDLPSGKDETLAGPGVAARASCDPVGCSGVRVFRMQKLAWFYSLPNPDTIASPRVFLSPDALVVELHSTETKEDKLVLIHPNVAPAPLPSLPHSMHVVGVSSVSGNGQRFALQAAGEVGICGVFDIWCNQKGQTLVIDVPANRIVFQQEISTTGGISSLSPDGKRLAVFDRDKLTVYSLP